MEVIIVEDEKIASENLVRLLNKINSAIQIKAVFETIVDTVAWLKKNVADLIFLDIHLADGNSFKIFDEVMVKSPVIFTTAYDQYAIKAFKVNSVDYLLKPFSIEELEAAINKYKAYSRFSDGHSIDIKAIKNALGLEKTYRERFLVYFADKIKSIKTAEIAYFYSEDKYSYLKTYNNQTFSLDRSLDKIEQEIDPQQFFRINRQMLINFDAIENMVNMSKSRIGINMKPKPDKDVLVSFNKMSKFRKWINK